MLATGGASAASPAAAPAACPAEGSKLPVPGALPVSRAAVAQGRLSILAIGSSSIEGVGASRPELGFVPLLEAGLERRLPGVEVTVANRGIGGESTFETVNRLERELRSGPFDLVLWQLGTNDVLRSRPVRDFLDDFRRGQAILDRARTDVLVIDPQQLPDTPANTFRSKIPALAANSELVLAEAGRVGYAASSRHRAMQGWSGLPGGGVGPDNLHFNDEGYACWAKTTAEHLARALRKPDQGAPQGSSR